MIKIRVFWEKDSEIETAQAVTNAIDSIIEGKQKQLGISRGHRSTNDPLHSFGIDVSMEKVEAVGKEASRRSSKVP